MPEIEITNAKITDTQLGFEDRGILTIWLTLDYGGSGQGYGGFAMDSWSEDDQRRVGTQYGCNCIMGILRTLGVEKWEDVKGQLIRVKRPAGWSGRVEAIGHIIEDRWFSFDAEVAV